MTPATTRVVTRALASTSLSFSLPCCCVDVVFGMLDRGIGVGIDVETWGIGNGNAGGGGRFSCTDDGCGGKVGAIIGNVGIGGMGSEDRFAVAI